MSDIWTMIWKEWTELISEGGRSQLIRPLIVVVVMGVVLPWRLGLTWLALAYPMPLIVLFLPFISIISFIGDAIAGERERHTLETLLASRISDRAILLGKVIVTVAYTWALVIVSLLVGAVTVNLTHGNEQGQAGWMFYHPLDLFLGVAVLSLLVTLLAASGGVLVSLRAATVRQAQQFLIVGALALALGGFLLISVLPSDLFSSLSSSQILLIAMAVVAILDLVFLGLSLVSFRRSRLILN